MPREVTGESTRSNRRAEGLASPHRLPQPPMGSSAADIPQRRAAAAFLRHANAATEVLALSRGVVARYRACGRVAPPAPVRLQPPEAPSLT